MEPVSVIFVIIGIVFVVSGSLAHYRQRVLQRRCTGNTTGTVTEIQKKTTYETDSDGHRSRKTVYYPVFRYTAGGGPVTVVSHVGTGSPRFAAGDSVDIRFDPDQPELHYALQDKTANNAGIIFILIGVLATLVAVFVQWLSLTVG